MWEKHPFNQGIELKIDEIEKSNAELETLIAHYKEATGRRRFVAFGGWNPGIGVSLLEKGFFR